MEQVGKYFEANPDALHFYHTPDGFAFLKEQDAQAHAFSKRLTVQKTTRREYEAWKSGDDKQMQEAAELALMAAQIEAEEKEAQRQKSTRGALAAMDREMKA